MQIPTPSSKMIESPTRETDKRSRETTCDWPRKVDVFGVQISVTDYDELVGCILDSAIAGEPAVVSLFAVHAVITASDDPDLRRKVNTFQAIGPDGQPVRWAMNWLHKTKLSDRVYGPETTLRLCKAAADKEIPIYLYGSTPSVLERLSSNLISNSLFNVRNVGAYDMLATGNWWGTSSSASCSVDHGSLWRQTDVSDSIRSRRNQCPKVIWSRRPQQRQLMASS